MLNAGSRVAMLVGAGALVCVDEVIAADVLGAIGLLGTKASWELMSRCDTLLIVGSGFPYSEFGAIRSSDGCASPGTCWKRER